MGIGQSNLHARVDVKTKPDDLEIDVGVTSWEKGFIIYEEEGKIEVKFDDPRFGIQQFRFTQARKLPMDEETFYLAAEQGALGSVQKWLNDGPNIDVDATKILDGRSALHCACMGGHVDIVRYLVEEKNCSMNIITYDGYSALDIALQNGHWAVVSYILHYIAKEAGEKPAEVLAESFIAEMGPRIQLNASDLAIFLSRQDFLRAGKIQPYSACKTSLKKEDQDASVLFLCGGGGAGSFDAAKRFLDKEENQAVQYVFLSTSCLENPSHPGPQLLYAACRADKLLILPEVRKLTPDEVYPPRPADAPKPEEEEEEEGEKGTLRRRSKSLRATVMTDLMALLKQGPMMTEIICCLLTSTQPFVQCMFGAYQEFMELPADVLHRDDTGFFGYEDIHHMRAGFAVVAADFTTIVAEGMQIQSEDLYFVVKKAWLMAESCQDPSLLIKKLMDVLVDLETKMRSDANIQKALNDAVSCQKDHVQDAGLQKMAENLGDFASTEDRAHALNLLLCLFYFCRGDAYLKKLTAPVVPKEITRVSKKKSSTSGVAQKEETKPSEQTKPPGPPQNEEPKKDEPEDADTKEDEKKDEEPLPVQEDENEKGDGKKAKPGTIQKDENVNPLEEKPPQEEAPLAKQEEASQAKQGCKCTVQ